jgi:hypothetical protein
MYESASPPFFTAEERGFLEERELENNRTKLASQQVNGLEKLRQFQVTAGESFSCVIT